MEPIKTGELSSSHYMGNLAREIETYLLDKVGNKPRIISVGCGSGEEAGPISTIFPNSTYKGIDMSPAMIELAKETNISIPGKFEVADATKKEAFDDQPWDVVILRNPQVTGGVGIMDEKWAKIIKNSIEALKKDGIVFITTPSEEERAIIVNYLGQFSEKLKILINQANQHTGGKRVFRDEFVVVAKKIEVIVKSSYNLNK